MLISLMIFPDPSSSAMYVITSSTAQLANSSSRLDVHMYVDGLDVHVPGQETVVSRERSAHLVKKLHVQNPFLHQF